MQIPSLSFPLQGFTLDWYEKLFTSEALLRSARNSLVVALGSSLTATLMGTMVALLMMRYQFRSKGLLVAMAVLPLIVPYIVLAVALFLLFSVLNIDRSLLTVGMAHTVVALPYVLLIVGARLAGFDASLEEAAMDLGARLSHHASPHRHPDDRARHGFCLAHRVHCFI